jgi:hypothetical protein
MPEPDYCVLDDVDQISKDTSTILGRILIIFNSYFFVIMDANLTQISTAAFAAKFQSKRGK